MNHYTDLKPYAIAFKHNPTDEIQYTNCTRTYRSSPSAITLQIRGHKPLINTETYNKKVKPRNIFASVQLSKSQALELIAALQQEVEGVSDEGADNQLRIHAALTA